MVEVYLGVEVDDGVVDMAEGGFGVDGSRGIHKSLVIILCWMNVVFDILRQVEREILH